MLNVRNKNVEIFNKTREMSNNEFKESTENLKKNTKVYQYPLRDIKVDAIFKQNKTDIIFTNGGTVSTGYKYIDDDNRVAILNFADALVPGGLVLVGEVTQEENICRCSNLYESITTDVADRDYYKRNAYFGDVYSDALIYSKDVTVFRDDINYTLIHPKKLDVITCPAPFGGNTSGMRDILTHRIECIVKSAVANAVDVLVLGAWGCGAFAQDYRVIAQCFGKVLNKYNGYFKLVDFAIRNNDGSKTTFIDNFKDEFWRGFND